MKIHLQAVFGVALACLLSWIAIPALAHTHEAAFVWNDSGGNVLSYRLRTIKLRQRGTRLEFHGRCGSACTLYLALPSRQLCITRHVAFRFHAPYGANQKWNAVAADYMMNWYPEWVRSWILENGGLSPQIRTMNYNYASQHLRTCD
jgi:hypothetical protein